MMLSRRSSALIWVGSAWMRAADRGGSAAGRSLAGCGAVAAATLRQRSAFGIQPAVTSPRFGRRDRHRLQELRRHRHLLLAFRPGDGPSTFLPAARATAAAAASLPSTRASFQTGTVLRAERDAVQGGVVTVLARHRHAADAAAEAPPRPRRPCRRSRPPPRRPCCRCAVRICSMFFWATSGFQPSVYSSPTIFTSPALMAFGEHLLLARAQEVGVRVGGRALDHHVVALGLRGQHGLAPAGGPLPCCRR